MANDAKNPNKPPSENDPADKRKKKPTPLHPNINDEPNEGGKR